MSPLLSKSKRVLQTAGNHIAPEVLGYSQEWFDEPWQKLAGCGPTAVCYMVSHHFLRDGIWQGHDRKSVLSRMNSVWQEMIPTRHGLFRTRQVAQGLRHFLVLGDYPYHVHVLPISPDERYRPTATMWGEFLTRALDADSPIAFLNRHPGQEKTIDPWHWVPIVGLDLEQDWALIYDEEREKEFAPLRWLTHTTMGGGAIYMEKKE